MLKTFVATLCVIGVALGGEAPVVLWGANIPSQPALKTISQKDFANIIEPLLKENMVVVFQTEGLSASDLKCATSTEESCFAFLGGTSERTYYKSVLSVGEAVRSVAPKLEFKTVDRFGKLESPVSCAPNKAVFINFDKTEGKRDAVLKAHDDAISAIAEGIKCRTVYLYTATPGGTLLRDGGNFLIFFTKVEVQIDTTTSELTFDTLTLTNNATDSFQYELTGTGKPVTLNISQFAGYYYLESLKYDGISFFTTGVNAPTTFSYFCGDLTLQGQGAGGVPNDYYLLWKSLQFQAPFNSIPYNSTFVFGDAWHCVGFVTPAILMGLFVVVLMLAITFTGICWMMDINTMDRFDDPKGKTITINTAE